MPAARTRQLIGTELHPAFYTSKVQKILEPYQPELQKRKRSLVDPKDHAALLAWPLIAFEIVSQVTMRASGQGPNRERFWCAYEDDPELAAKLFVELTEYNQSWPDQWKKQRLLHESLMAPEFEGQVPPWADVREYIESLFEGLGEPPAYWPKNFSEHLSEINQRRYEILELWQESITAKAKLEKAGIRIPPLLLRPVKSV
jgi:hypothetical protein